MREFPTQNTDILDELANQKLPFALVADGIQDPGNLGTLIRSADWFGMHALFVTEKTTDPWSTKCVQASMGSIFKVPVLEWKDEFQAKTALCCSITHWTSTALTYHEVAWSAGLIWVGSESHGLQVAEALPHQKITIPRLGTS